MADQVLLPLAAFLLLLGVRRISDNERLVVYRLERRLGVRGPGLVWLVPFVDRTVRIALDEELPQWRYMPDELLRARVEQLAAARETGPPRDREGRQAGDDRPSE